MNLETQPLWQIAFETSIKLLRSSGKFLGNYLETSFFGFFSFDIFCIEMCHRPKQEMNLETQPSWQIAFETSIKLLRSSAKFLGNYQETSFFGFFFI
jgi:hypothetical protein